MKTLFRIIDQADQNLFLTIYQLKSRWQNQCFSLLTKLGGLCFQTCLALFLIILPSTKNTGLKLALIQLIVATNVQFLKQVVSRVRPYDTLENINPLKTERDYSFPSGHTAAAFSTALAIKESIPIMTIFPFSLALLIGYSRIYLGVHYPSDVIAGGLIGLGITKILLLIT